MNWGWNDRYNGYYGYNDFVNSNGSYNYKSEVVINIHP